MSVDRPPRTALDVAMIAGSAGGSGSNQGSTESKSTRATPTHGREGGLVGETARFPPTVYCTQSLSPCASGSDSSFFSVLFSIWRIRSRVTPKALPTSSSVHGWEPSRP